MESKTQSSLEEEKKWTPVDQLLNYTMIDLRMGSHWTDEEHRRMATEYERMEGGNDVVRCKKKTPSPAAWRFMDEITDDLLQEILLRLPNGGSVIRSTTVCKRWHSLVHKNPSFDNFVARFVQHHDSKQVKEPYSDPTYVAALFGFSYTMNFRCSFAMPFHELSLRRRRAKICELSFISTSYPSSFIIRASCGDLVLASYSYWEYYIWNPVTMHWFELPQIPHSEFVRLPPTYFKVNTYHLGHALVRHDPLSYTVVIVSNSRQNKMGECIFHLVLFKSSTGEWTQTPMSLRYQLHPRLFWYKRIADGSQLVCTREGVVHWLDGTREQIFVVAAFDPVSFDTRLIPLPRKTGCLAYSRSEVRLGVVRDRLRLFSTEQVQELRFSVQIWELDDGRWTLVHSLLLTLEDATANTPFSILYLDPYDDNVIYLLHRNRISRYEIGQTEDVGIVEFPLHLKSNEGSLRSQVIPLLHPPWPTQISLLESSTYKRQQS